MLRRWLGSDGFVRPAQCSVLLTDRLI